MHNDSKTQNSFVEAQLLSEKKPSKIEGGDKNTFRSFTLQRKDTIPASVLSELDLTVGEQDTVPAEFTDDFLLTKKETLERTIEPVGNNELLFD